MKNVTKTKSEKSNDESTEFVAFQSTKINKYHKFVRIIQHKMAMEYTQHGKFHKFIGQKNERANSKFYMRKEPVGVKLD